MCVRLQTPAWRCNLICRKERVVSHDWFKGTLAQSCANVPDWWRVSVCMHAYMHACVYTPEVFICVHVLHYSNMTGCYSGIPNSRKKKVLNFVVKKTQSGIYSSVLVLDEIYLEKLLENKIAGN